MQLLGVTGGVGMGKSTGGEFLSREGVPVLDTDVIARQLVEPGQPALKEIVARFGASVIGADGALNRKELARIAFSDERRRVALEGILHPRIREIWADGVNAWRAAGQATGAVIIPLLFETKAAPLFDKIICVACSGATQWQRLRQRGWNDGEIRQRLEAQLPLEQKINPSDFVVWTDTSLDAHAAQWRLILARCREESQTAS